jgi:hypothetical protein
MVTAAFVVGIVAVTFSTIILIRMFIIDRIKENNALLVEFNNYVKGEIDNFRGANFFMFDENLENFKNLSRRKQIKLVRKINKMIKKGETRINLEVFPEIERKISI